MELLIVLAVLAILLSILLPVLGKARNSARMVQCIANQRAIMQGMLIYCTTDHGYVPAYPSSVAGESVVYWQTDLQFVYNPQSATYYNCPSTEPPVPGVSTNNGLINGVPSYVGTATMQYLLSNVASSYGFNLALDSSPVPRQCKIDPGSEVRKLSQGPPIVAVADCVWTGFKGDSKTAPQNMLNTFAAGSDHRRYDWHLCGLQRRYQPRILQSVYFTLLYRSAPGADRCGDAPTGAHKRFPCATSRGGCA